MNGRNPVHATLLFIRLTVPSTTAHLSPATGGAPEDQHSFATTGLPVVSHCHKPLICRTAPTQYVPLVIGARLSCAAESSTANRQPPLQAVFASARDREVVAHITPQPLPPSENRWLQPDGDGGAWGHTSVLPSPLASTPESEPEPEPVQVPVDSVRQTPPMQVLPLGHGCWSAPHVNWQSSRAGL